jgi:hypothetical protein
MLAHARLRPYRPIVAISVLALASVSTPARAGLIVNGGFELPVLASGQAITFAPGATIPLTTGAWTVIGDPGTSVYLLETAYSEPFNNVTQFNAFEGSNSVDLSGPANVGPTAGVRQIVAVTPGDEYVLSFEVGRVTPNAGPGGVYPGAATVDLLIDGGARLPFTNSGVSNGFISWQTFTHRFTASGSTATIDFLNGTPAGTNEAGLDAVSLVPASTLDAGAPAPTGSLSFAIPNPNPARDGLTLRFTLSRDGFVRLSVFDVSGRRVCELGAGERGAGEHVERFALRSGSGGHLANGLYVVTLEAEGRVLTRRLLVIR